MDRYCIKEFLELKDKSTGGVCEGYEWIIQKHREECKCIDYIICDDDKRWNVYKISSEEKREILTKCLLHPEEKYLIHIPVGRMNKTTEKEQFIIDFMNQTTKGYLMNLLQTAAVEQEVINELYLVMRNKLSEEEKFKNGFQKEEIKTVRDYLKNKNRGKSKQRIPFDFTVENLDDYVRGFGSDIIRLWAYSKNFRNLMQWKEYDSDKYQLQNYLNIEFEMLRNIEENDLLLNKMIGGNIIISYYTMLYPYLKGIENDYEKYIIDFIKMIMECDSNYLCCEMIKFFGNEMCLIKDYSLEYKVKRIILYTQYLKEVIPVINSQYEELLKNICVDLKAVADSEEWMEFVLEAKISMYESDPYKFKYADTYIDAENSHQMRLVIKWVMEKCCRKYMFENNL